MAYIPAEKLSLTKKWGTPLYVSLGTWNNEDTGFGLTFRPVLKPTSPSYYQYHRLAGQKIYYEIVPVTNWGTTKDDFKSPLRGSITLQGKMHNNGGEVHQFEFNNDRLLESREKFYVRLYSDNRYRNGITYGQLTGYVEDPKGTLTIDETHKAAELKIGDNNIYLNKLYNNGRNYWPTALSALDVTKESNYTVELEHDTVSALLYDENGNQLDSKSSYGVLSFNSEQNSKVYVKLINSSSWSDAGYRDKFISVSISQADSSRSDDDVEYDIPLDAVLGTESNDSMHARKEGQYLAGLAGDDSLYWGKNTTLNGGEGDDYLYGFSPYSTILIGGNGSDTFRVYVKDYSENTVVIKDYEVSDKFSVRGKHTIGRDGEDGIIYDAKGNADVIFEGSAHVLVEQGYELDPLKDPINKGAATLVVDGDAFVGNTLKAVTKTSDPNGDGTFSYTWKQSLPGQGWQSIATGQEFTLGANQEGRQIRVSASYVDGDGFSEVVESVPVNVAYANDGKAGFNIEGELTVGSTLSVSQEASDPDGDGSFSHVWQQSNDGISWVDFAPGSTVKLGESSAGKTVRVRTSYKDAQGFDENVLSNAVQVKNLVVSDDHLIPADALLGTEGNDYRLRATADGQYLAGLGGTDFLSGFKQNVTMNGGEGNDYLSGQSRLEPKLIGGNGVDNFSIWTANWSEKIGEILDYAAEDVLRIYGTNTLHRIGSDAVVRDRKGQDDWIIKGAADILAQQGHVIV